MASKAAELEMDINEHRYVANIHFSVQQIKLTYRLDFQVT